MKRKHVVLFSGLIALASLVLVIFNLITSNKETIMLKNIALSFIFHPKKIG